MEICSKFISKTLKNLPFFQQFSKNLSSLSTTTRHFEFKKNVFSKNLLNSSSLTQKASFNLITFSNLIINGHSSRSLATTSQLSAYRKHPHRYTRDDITIIKWNKYDGSRMPNEDVLMRFKRLDWGVWIRPMAGATRMLWKKKAKRVHRLKQNVFCSAKQSRRLDKMVVRFYRTPRVYADDPYAPYQARDDFWMTRGQPLRYN